MIRSKKEAMQRALTIVDEPLDNIVKELCERFGYGAVMDSASRQWIKIDSIGAFYIGGCLAIKLSKV